MSERTTIGGTVYEAIGSSSSNLLLKCNGTARIQWGGKLIDLIKNGKIASGDSQELIFIVSDESEIKSDGVYVLTTEESDQLWICKGGNKYDLTRTDLYISASKEQNLTVEQKKQALDNIGMYYETLDELKNSGIQTGIVYVVENKTLYTVQQGVIEEFEAKLKTITVEEGSEEGVKVINSSVKIVLSILDDEYLVLADQRITANYSIHVKNSAQLGSEGADKTQGYRLYFDGDTSWLDVDEINVRNGCDIKLYKEVTYDTLMSQIAAKTLEPHEWYLITDYQNPWKLQSTGEDALRPILVRALNEQALYEKGYLFKDHTVQIKYNPNYKQTITKIKAVDGTLTDVSLTTKGLITWMKDRFNNEANFDFLNYTDNENKELATLHFVRDFENEDEQKLYDKSVFPKNSHDNKLVIYDLKGNCIKEGILDYLNATTIDFQFDDSKEVSMTMYGNNIECRGLILTPACTTFYNNTLKQTIKLEISSNFNENEFLSIYNRTDQGSNNYDETSFQELPDNTLFSNVQFTNKTEKVKSTEFKNCVFQNELINCTFGTIENFTFTKLIENSTINEIKNKVTISSEITNSCISTISDNSVIDASSINECNIQTITNSTISSNLEKSSFEDIKNSSIKNVISNSVFKTLDTATINGTISNSTFNEITNSTLNGLIDNSTFSSIQNSTLNADFNLVIFRDLSNCTFDEGSIENSESFHDLSAQFNETDYKLLYDTTKRKEIYINNGVIQVICIPEVIFYRGMIIMHSGIEEIPPGWALCDGGEYEWNGKKSQTPDLRNRFIKATETDSASEVKASEEVDYINDKNELTLKKEHLPKHQHEIDITKLPQYTTDDITGNTSRYDPQSQYVNTDSGTLSVGVSVYVSVSVSVGESSDSDWDSDSSSDSITLSGTTLNYLGTGEKYEAIKHYHSIDWGSSNILTENNDIDVEQVPIKIEPNYFSLIFIMKL